MVKNLRPTADSRSHARWLHELCNVVSTASVAASLGRRLVRDDATAAEEVLREAELALSQCRELLAAAAGHIRDDAAPEPPPAGVLLSRRGGLGGRHDAMRGERRRVGKEPRMAR